MAYNETITGLKSIQPFDSKYQDIEFVARVVSLYEEVKPRFAEYFKENYENLERVGGELFSKADREKLDLEGRTALTTNLLLPIVLNLLSNFQSNQQKLSVLPRTMGDEAGARMIEQLIDYAHYQANFIDREFSRAFIDAIIMRLGWIVTDWSEQDDPLGMVRVKRRNPFRIVFDDFEENDMSDCNWIHDGGWYTPEEIHNIANQLGDETLHTEIDEFAKLFLGTDQQKGKQVATWLERVFGYVKKYFGKGQGYDSNGQAFENEDYYNVRNGRFFVMNFHERRIKTIYLLSGSKKDPMTNMWGFEQYDVTSQVTVNGELDQEKLAEIQSQFINSTLDTKREPCIYESISVPAWGMKMYDKPYDKKTLKANNQFKYTPIYCFDFNSDPLKHKSYIDHVTDPISYYNKFRNSFLDYLMKFASGETWYEEGALSELEEEFTTAKTGAFKKVKDGALTQNRIQRQQPPTFPAGLDRFSQELKSDTEYIVSVNPNAKGDIESAGESGVAIARRIKQSELMQSYVQQAAMGQLIHVGRITLALIQRYMTEERALRILTEEGNLTWLVVNQQTVNGIINDVTIGEYDIILSKQPYGETSKMIQFQMQQEMFTTIASINPIYADMLLDVLIKASMLANKDEWLNGINLAKGQIAQQQQLASAQQQIQTQGQVEDVRGKMNSNLQNEAVLQQYLLGQGTPQAETISTTN